MVLRDMEGLEMTYQPENYGHRIYCLEQLRDAAESRRALFAPGHVSTRRKPLPAAVFLGWPGRQLLSCFISGLYIYEKVTKLKEKPPEQRN